MIFEKAKHIPLIWTKMDQRAICRGANAALNGGTLPEETQGEKPTRQRRRSFSLIELLLVIAIMAILSAILLPALNKARGKAKQIKCLFNIKQMSIGVLMYANDYDSYIMPSADGASRWYYGPDANNLCNSYIPLPKAKTMGGSNDLVSCPEQPFTSYRTSGIRFSYGMFAYVASQVRGTSIWWYKISHLKAPSRTPIFTDTTGVIGSELIYGRTYLDNWHARHSSGINLGLLDNSAQWQKMPCSESLPTHTPFPANGYESIFPYSSGQSPACARFKYVTAIKYQ